MCCALLVFVPAARRQSIDLAVAGAGTACTAVRVNQSSLYSRLILAAGAACSAWLLVQISEIADCPSWDGSIPAAATDTDGGLGSALRGALTFQPQFG